MSVRQSRKLDHIHYALTLEDGPSASRFADISLIHNCLPDLSWQQIDLSTTVCGLELVHPVFINAITGGAQDVMKTNAMLAELAQQSRIAMAVGSQFAALEDPAVLDSYRIVRQYNPNGILFANLGAHVTPEQAKQAVAMIEADALQIHINTAQEILMAEGDRDFRGYLHNVAAIVDAVGVPVIVKEVGCGIAREQARLLVEAGVRAIDVGGAGGTNFRAIEAARSQRKLEEELYWGIPTAISALEVASVLPDSADLIVSGGVRSGLDVVKAMTIGAAAVGIATPLIKKLYKGGVAAAVLWLDELLQSVRQYMLLCGAQSNRELRQTPLIISGYSREWLQARGIDTAAYAQRERHG
ncbi:type 2 isopentenyl-diphosphate Delta-isomerase [Propionispora hippei]|uniref:Isopentenyl-diphosphate delta-isomerase n=1 Tax=Propionispora hippei DSM 15287 TaxID=1123003 RepID=A0A1M6N2Y9_9FIRM|nr:type 2 isopentenyl-diphosphate Delta-isomerase [Propionispora hippei]SHJ90054.1 isopentenyl-diphosphate delta-isomerase [Propionispora hippei DSM 15287]